MSTSTTAPAATAPRGWALAVLTGGPVATVLGLQALYAAPDQTVLSAAPLWMYLVVAVVMWSPLPFSLPAVLLERARDEALPGYEGPARLLRAALLVPYMLTRSPHRVEFLASVVGFALALVLVWPALP